MKVHIYPPLIIEFVNTTTKVRQQFSRINKQSRDQSFTEKVSLGFSPTNAYAEMTSKTYLKLMSWQLHGLKSLT